MYSPAALKGPHAALWPWRWEVARRLGRPRTFPFAHTMSAEARPESIGEFGVTRARVRAIESLTPNVSSAAPNADNLGLPVPQLPAYHVSYSLQPAQRSTLRWPMRARLIITWEGIQ
jgi:hypothetical protein